MSSSIELTKTDRYVRHSALATADAENKCYCPLCGSEKTSRKNLIEMEPVVALWQKFYGIDIRSEVGDFSHVELRGCHSCSISFFLPESLAGSGDMYAKLEEMNRYYPADKWEYRTALTDLRNREKILEIGCGSGKFIALARVEAALSIEGLEQNKRAILEATQQGLHVRDASAESLATEFPASYDAICSFQVVEHVPRLGNFIQTCCALLKPGGLLVAAMPNQRSYIRYMVNPLDMPPHHMTRWTRATIERIPQFFPLKLVRFGYEPLPDHQIELCVDTYESILYRYRIQILFHPWLRTRLIAAIRRLKFNRFIRGQNMYACYVRL
jgi:2-polyprenyl-3-methyl-5-hydroxy-6-metoxy-1,4-benzoquinol methylase